MTAREDATEAANAAAVGDERLPGTVAAYDASAERYAAWSRNYENFPGLDDEVRQFAAGLAGRRPVLDAGCGAGRDMALLGTSGRPVVGVDASAGLLAVAARSAPGAAWCVQGDLRALPLADGVFAGAWVCAALVHADAHDRARALRELVRVVAPGGRVAVSMRDHSADGWETRGEVDGRRWFAAGSGRRLLDEAAAAGLEATALESSPRQAWFTVTGRVPAAR